MVFAAAGDTQTLLPKDSSSLWLTPWRTQTHCLPHSLILFCYWREKWKVDEDHRGSASNGLWAPEKMLQPLCGNSHTDLLMVAVQTVCPSWRQLSAFVYKQDLTEAYSVARQLCSWLQRVTLQSSFPMACDTIHFQLKDSQTLLAGPSIVTKVLIVLIYLTAGLQGFDSPV